MVEKTIHVLEAEWDWLWSVKRDNRLGNLAEALVFVRRKLPKQFQYLEGV